MAIIDNILSGLSVPGRFAAGAALAFAALSCSGNIDDGSSTSLSTDKAVISADGKDAVTFTVTDSGKDVTSESVITCTNDGSAVENAVFSTDVPGTYYFVAQHNGKQSTPVTVTAESKVEATFKRNICVAEFTGTWCTNCPGAANYLNGYFIREIVGEENGYVLAFHGDDEYEVPDTKKLMSVFGIDAYPAFLFDMREVVPQGELSSNYYRNVQKEYPAHCGLAISSVYDEATRTASVSVRLTSDNTSTYRVAVFVIEDNVIGRQDGGGVAGTDTDSYNHRHMVRRTVSADYTGDNWGQVAAGAEQKKDYSIVLDPAWNAENVHIYALAYDSTGSVNNVIGCHAVNGEKGYEYTNDK